MSDLDERRGRQPIVSTGRGGAGNILRSPSGGRDPDIVRGGERGRELSPAFSSDRITHSGRGGAGNIRSPSRQRDAAAELREEALQERLVAEARGRNGDAAISSGRGGAGNIARDKSRSRSQVRESKGEHHSSGRGGFGNIAEERDSIDAEKDAATRDHEAEILAKHRADGAGKPHMTGKGGAGNMRSSSGVTHVDMSTLTLEEREAYAKVHARDKEHGHSTGKGGAGNIQHSPARAEDGERGREHKGVFGSVLRSISRATGRERSADRARD